MVMVLVLGHRDEYLQDVLVLFVFVFLVSFPCHLCKCLAAISF